MAEKLSDIRSDPKRPVFRVRLEQFSWTAAETAGVAKSMPVCGKARVIAGIANNSTNAITYTTTISDEDSIQLYTKTDWAEAATEVVTLDSDTEVYIPPGATVTITPSGAPGTTGGTFDLILIGG